MAVYEQFLRPFRWTPQHLSDLVPWRAGIPEAGREEPGVVLLKYRYSLMRVYGLRGLDTAAETKEAQAARILQANNLFKRLGGAWMVQSEAQRVPFTGYPVVSGGHPVLAYIDRERYRALVQAPDDPQPRSWETRYFLTLTWTPALGATNGQRPSVSQFVADTDHFVTLLRGLLAHVEPLEGAALWSYLKTTVSATWHPMHALHSPLDIDVQLCDGGYDAIDPAEPVLREQYLRICSVIGFPAESSAGMMRELETLAFPFRWCTRWLGMERHTQGQMLAKTEKAWRDTEKTTWQKLSENVTQQEIVATNPEALLKAQDARAAREELGADLVGYGQFTTSVLVWDGDPQAANDKIRAVMQAFQARGFVVKQEQQRPTLRYLRRDHATAAWLGMMPGAHLHGVRRTKQSSLTLAHLFPGLQAVWPGPERDAYLDGPPWFIAHTDTHTAYRVSNHVRDVGHTLFFGPTGSGKSVLLAFLVAMWLYNYPWTRVFWFDVDKSARLLTLLLGGQWYDLGVPGTQLQPLRDIDDPVERAWMLGWLLDLLETNQVQLTYRVKQFVMWGFDELARRPVQQRTLSTLLHRMEDVRRKVENKTGSRRRDVHGIAQPDSRIEAVVEDYSAVIGALRPYCAGGAYGWILDGDHDDIATGRLLTFEQRTLLTNTRLVEPVMGCVFHDLESSSV
jgi:type IV secretion system protein VirB4